MSSISKRAGRRLAVGLLVAATSAATGCGTSARDAPAPTETAPSVLPPGASVSGQQPVRRTQPEQAASFSLLRTAPEGLSVEATRALHTPPHGMNPRLAQKLPETIRGDFWAVPGDGFLCLVSYTGDGSVGSTCTTNRNAAETALAAIRIYEPSQPGVRRGHRLIVGVARDGARLVEARTGAISTKIRTGRHGVFVLRDEAQDPPDRLAAL